MQSAILCYAAADREFACELASYLELNCAEIAFDREEFADSGNLLEAVGRALSADFPILLLSSDAVPPAWTRAVWEPILVDEARRFERQIAYVLLRPCKFPEVFRRGAFFDLSQNRLAGQRSLKGWLLRQNPFSQTVIELPDLQASADLEADALEGLACKLSDRPDIETNVNREIALAFAHACAADFEGVFWLNCAHRSRAGIAGDAAHVLGLKLRGTLEENTCALRQFCAKRRMLVVCEHAAPREAEWASAGAKASFLFVAEDASPSPRSLEETAALFVEWQTNPDACLRALGDAQYHAGKLPDYTGEQWQTALLLSSAAFSLMKQTGRLAEAYEFLETEIAALRAKGRPFKAHQLVEWEKSWILEEWGQPAPAAPRPMLSSSAVQLNLFD